MFTFKRTKGQSWVRIWKELEVSSIIQNLIRSLFVNVQILMKGTLIKDNF